MLAGPVAFSQLGHVSVGVVDTLMAGQISRDALAAATVALSVFFPLFMMYIGFSQGFTPLIAQAHGEGDDYKITRIFKHAVWLNLIVGTILTIALLFGIFLIPLLHQPEHIVEEASLFFSVIAVSVFPIVIFQILKQFIEGLGQTKQAMMVSIMGNIINVVLILILVYGWFGLPEMGLYGIAYATMIARCAMALAMVIYFFYDEKYKVYKALFKNVPLHIRDLKTVFYKSYPVALQMTFESGAFSLAALFIGTFGTAQLAAHQIALNLASVTYMVATGVAAAATVRVGYEYGRKEKTDLQRAGNTAIGISIMFMCMTALLFALFRSILPSYYTDDSEVIRIASILLCFVALFQLSDGIQVVSMGSLRGMGDVVIPSSIAFTAYWIIGLPLGWILAFKMGMEVYGIWIGLTTGLFFASVILLLRFLLKSKKVVFETNF